ncbi:hypothetical protein EV363DRAFT_1402329 [Boletus edulis]|nr:hypothetical protein EV363DRAFT_1402329 [Boletus edulis]
MAWTRVVNGKYVHAKQTKFQRDKCHKWHVTLATDLGTMCQSFREEAVSIAKKTWMLFLNSLFCKHWHVNSWNVFLKEKLNGTNSGHKKGHCFKLSFFSELLAKYQKLSPADKKTLIAKVQAAHDSKVLPTHANPRLSTKPLLLHFHRWIRMYWTALCAQTGIEDHTVPKVFFTKTAEKFVHAVLNVEPCYLALWLESWIVSGIGIPFSHHSFPYINHWAYDILTEHRVTRKVKMNYTNCELHIIKCHGIALIGWPIGGRQEVEKLLSALQEEMCKCVKFTDKQLATQIAQNKAQQAAGKKVYCP